MALEKHGVAMSNFTFMKTNWPELYENGELDASATVSKMERVQKVGNLAGHSGNAVQRGSTL